MLFIEICATKGCAAQGLITLGKNISYPIKVVIKKFLRKSSNIHTLKIESHEFFPNLQVLLGIMGEKVKTADS